MENRKTYAQLIHEIRIAQEARIPVPGFDGNCQIGLGAGIACADHTCRLPENAVYIDTYTMASALIDKAFATDGPKDSEPYHWQYHATLQDAIAWLKERIDRNAILS